MSVWDADGAPVSLERMTWTSDNLACLQMAASLRKMMMKHWI